MAALQDALESLGPISWDEVPSSPDALREYLRDLSHKARLIIDSVPEPPSPVAGTDSSTNLASNASSSPSARISPSPARLGTPDPTLQSLQREWSKPIKTSNTRDNPLELLIHKLQGRDGNGAWFARRSVHEGLSFSKWQAKLSTEMLETLRQNRKRLAKGRTPDQSVRGIGAEEHVEEIEVCDEEGRRIGVVNVFHVSAQFPKPTTPRDFVALIINWEVRVDGGGRYWMMVSKPCEHPDVPPSQGYIRGQYESVEFIREIPVKKRREDGVVDEKGSQESIGDGEGKRGRRRGDTASSEGPVKRERGDDTKSGVDGKQPGQEDAGEDDDDEESNPVEWVMVTRSDPGGTIPRWMVEKGTPKSICTDAGKFLDWACREKDPSTKDEQDEENGRPKGKPEDTAGASDGSDGESSDDDLSDIEVEHHGLIASFAYLLNAGLDRYAPQAVLDYLPRQGQLSRTNTDDSLASLNDKPPRSNPDSITTPVSPSAKRKDKESSETRSQVSQGNASAAASIKSGLATPLEQDIPSLDAMMAKKGKMTSHEKQLIKLAERKRDTEAQLERVRSEIQSLHLPPREDDLKRDPATSAALASVGDPASDQASSSPASSVKKGSDKSSGDKNNKQQQQQRKRPANDSARMHKVASGLFNDEAKLVKQLSKINQNQLKEASKIEARQRKDAEREVKARTRSEVDTLRQENEKLKKELEKFRNERKQWVDLIGSLQAENTKLTAGKQSELEK
ncbi:uncharacterized protein KD926_007027 [Aspergillus affinis]|uniref:uncharacterized protein n=1 Tax=Aspergillus affinis TaxID=1070780 RepID=UPI0022FECF41|nr:uncharacterized protein KD926_007027 [Aspergillus affinis]KAI9045726.1 hypothetical protein KD926_007027 [Aspergillus affinis]